MSKTLRNRGRISDRRSETKLILGVVLASVTPAIAAVAMIVASSRPDFYYTDFTGQIGAGASTRAGWPALRSSSGVAAMSGGIVQLPGYMLPLGGHRYGEVVDAFVLVPDPGNWLHAPHLHREEAVIVRLDAGRTVSLVERRAVWVRGTLSAAGVNAAQSDNLYTLNAAEV